MPWYSHPRIAFGITRFRSNRTLITIALCIYTLLFAYAAYVIHTGDGYSPLRGLIWITRLTFPFGWIPGYVLSLVASLLQLPPLFTTLLLYVVGLFNWCLIAFILCALSAKYT